MSTFASTAFRKSIHTNNLGKEEVYKYLALAESLQLPVLLIGPVGTSKTSTVTDWANTSKETYDPDSKSFVINPDNNHKVFFLETDTGTMSKDIKGSIDVKKLVMDSEYKIKTTIHEFPYIVINEIDKATGDLRNSFLSIMNEKVIFNGEETIPVPWKLFVATCNQIPEDEKNSPFWDRFIIKMHVDRLSVQELNKYFEDGDKKARYDYSVNIPSTEQINSVTIPQLKLNKFIELTYKRCTDRVLTSVPLLTKAISLIWTCSVDKALVKAAEILTDKSLASILSQKIMSDIVKNLHSEIHLIKIETDPARIAVKMEALQEVIQTLVDKGEITQSDVIDITVTLEEILDQMFSNNVLSQAEIKHSGDTQQATEHA